MKPESRHYPLLDNAKFCLIFLVVFGHIIEPYITISSPLKALYLTIYSFHMPAFIIISGMLSKVTLTRQRVVTLIRKILVPLLAFTLIYEIFHLAVFKGPSAYLTGFMPYWILWYLLSLFIWRLTLPLFKNIPIWIALLISIGVSMAASLIPNAENILGFSRTLYFWPFFLLGVYLTPSFTAAASFNKIPRILCAGLMICFLYLFWSTPNLPFSLFYGTPLNTGGVMAVTLRSLTYGISVITCMAFLRLVPISLQLPKGWRHNTLYVYLWHGLPLKLIIALRINESAQDLPSAILLLAAIIISAVLVVMLSSETIKTLTDKLVFFSKS